MRLDEFLRRALRFGPGFRFLASLRLVVDEPSQNRVEFVLVGFIFGHSILVAKSCGPSLPYSNQQVGEELTGDPSHEEQERLPGEADVPLLQPAPSEERKEWEAEKAAENAYKKRQLTIAEDQVKVAQSNRNLTRMLAGFTLLGVIAGGIQAYFARKGVAAANNSAKAAQNAAYQSCLGAQISRNMLLQSQTVENDAHGSAVAAIYQAMAATESERAEMQLILGNAEIRVGKDMGVPFNTNNAGKTAAVGLIMKFRMVFLSRSEDPNFLYPEEQTARGNNSRAEPGPGFQTGTHRLVVLTPDGSAVVPTNSDLADYQAGTKDLILYGQMDYRDIFGGHHWRRFCQPFQIFTEGGVVKNVGHQKCTNYNQSDTGSTLVKATSLPILPSSLPEIVCTNPAQE